LAYTDDVVHRIYFRYRDSEDLALMNFLQVRESYRSDDYNYVVGDIRLADLVRVKESLAGRDLFLAAYPWD